MDTLERDVFDPPVINSWRRGTTRDQIQYATDLCRTELPYAERVRTIATFTVLDSREISDLIDSLAKVRAERLRRLRKRRPSRGRKR